LLCVALVFRHSSQYLVNIGYRHQPVLVNPCLVLAIAH